jgi:hypothetical protein
VELLAMALGPACAAGLAQWTGKLPLLWVAASAFALAALCWRGVPSGSPALSEPPLSEPHNRLHSTQPSKNSVGQDLALGCKLLLTNRPVMLLAVLNFTINLSFGVALSANAYVIGGVFRASDTALGLMNAGAGVVGFMNLMWMPRLLARWNIYRLGTLGFALMCAGLACMGMAHGVGLYAPAFLLAMAGVAWFNVFNRTQRIKAIQPEHLGKVIGPFYLINCMAYPLSGAITALLGPRLGVQNIIVFMAMVLAVPGAWLLSVTVRSFQARLSVSSATAGSTLAVSHGCHPAAATVAASKASS